MSQSNPVRPNLQQVGGDTTRGAVKAVDSKLGEYYLYCDRHVPMLFTENETNTQRIFGVANRTPYLKDGINNYVVHGQTDTVNPARQGTKVAAQCRLTLDPGQCQVIRVRLTNIAPGEWPKADGTDGNPFEDFDEILSTRRNDADEFYAAIIPRSLSADQANVTRQALSGMLWSKQFYNYDIDKWLEERG